MSCTRYILITLTLGLMACGKQPPESAKSQGEKALSSSAGPQVAKDHADFTVAPLQAALEVRRKETSKYGRLTQDAVIPVDACFVQEELRVPTTIGVVHAPYDSSDTFIAVARKSTESALSGTPLEPGCSRKEAGYWVRDSDGSGDFVFRVSAEAGLDAQLWWVPDSGVPKRADLKDMSGGVYIDRLLKVAGTRADADGDLKGALELVLNAQSMEPSSKRIAEMKTELVCLVHPPTAVKDLREFIDSFGSSEALDSTLAACLMEVKTAEAKEEADQLIEAVILRNPGQLKALSLKAEQLASEGRYAEAVQAYQDVLKHHPAAYMAHYGVATGLLSLGRNKEALDHLDRYLSVDPTDVDALFLRAGARVDVGNLEGAASDLKVLKNKIPEAPELPGLANRILKAEQSR